MRSLTRFFKRKPTAIWADALTLTRGVGMPLVIIIMIALKIKSFETVLAIVLISWITDWYDGMLARKTNQPSWIGDNEVAFDLSMIIFTSIYLLAVFTMPLFITAPLISWLSLCCLSIYGRIRHKAKSFIFAIEFLMAPALTVGLLLYAIFFGSTDAKIMTGSFLGLGLFHYRIGLRSRRRVIQALSHLKEDLHRATRFK